MLQRMGLGPIWTVRHAASAPAYKHGESDIPAMASVDELPAPPATPSTAMPMATAALPAELAPLPDPARVDALVPAAGAQPLVQGEQRWPNWDELQRSVSSCQACGLCQGRNKTVFGVGDRQASWMFIGEGPGRQEDMQGDPFVGPAGKLLDNMLRALGLDRQQQAYIANVVKCRPSAEDGRDRPPTAEEIAACLPYLQRQVELVQPDVIVALGRIAAVGLLGLPPDTAVSGLRGKLHTFQGRPLVVTYHPAYLLRQPADKAKVWRDLQMARAAHGGA